MPAEDPIRLHSCHASPSLPFIPHPVREKLLDFFAMSPPFEKLVLEIVKATGAPAFADEDETAGEERAQARTASARKPSEMQIAVRKERS